MDSGTDARVIATGNTNSEFVCWNGVLFSILCPLFGCDFNRYLIRSFGPAEIVLTDSPSASATCVLRSLASLGPACSVDGLCLCCHNGRDVGSADQCPR